MAGNWQVPKNQNICVAREKRVCAHSRCSCSHEPSSSSVKSKKIREFGKHTSPGKEPPGTFVF